MANELKISERAAPQPSHGEIAWEGGVLANQTMSPTGTSSQSSAFNAKTEYVILFSTVACFYTFGANPTAVAASHTYLPANVERREKVVPGQKIAVIT